MEHLQTVVVQSGPDDRPWCLRWQTENMSGPSFWYFTSEEQAKREELNLRRQKAQQKDLR